MILSATILFALYVAISVATFGAPPSLSDTHYLWKDRLFLGGAAFPLFLATFCALLMPNILEITDGSSWQFTGFVMVAALLFVAAAPMFKDRSEKKVHTTAAVISAVAGVAFTCAFGHWWVAVASVVIALNLAAVRPRSLVFWLEMAAFVSVLITLNTI